MTFNAILQKKSCSVLWYWWSADAGLTIGSLLKVSFNIQDIACNFIIIVLSHQKQCIKNNPCMILISMTSPMAFCLWQQDSRTTFFSMTVIDHGNPEDVSCGDHHMTQHQKTQLKLPDLLLIYQLIIVKLLYKAVRTQLCILMNLKVHVQYCGLSHVKWDVHVTHLTVLKWACSWFHTLKTLHFPTSVWGQFHEAV